MYITFIIIACLLSNVSPFIMWAGGVTDSQATIVISGNQGGTLSLSSRADLASPARASAITSDPFKITFQNLTASSRYYYGASTARVGTFSTFGEGQQNLKIIVGSCADTASNNKVFSAIKNQNADLMIHLGDLHYKDISTNSIQAFRDAYELTFKQNRQRELFQSLPMSYIWDDHDYGPNNADSSSPSKPAARSAYRMYFPHYPTELSPPDLQARINQAYTIGNVRFIITDLRSEQVSEVEVMSEEQFQWFNNELCSASSYSLVVWANTIPWIGKPSAGDSWLGYTSDRIRVANIIKNCSVTNLIAVAGDAHMLAIDDGSNSDYATGGGAGFPIFQAAAYDRIGSAKGGPFSEGCKSYEYHYVNQYGVLEIEDSGTGPVCVKMKGYRGEDANPIIQWSGCAPFVKTGQPGNDASCDIEAFPTWIYGLLVPAGVWALILASISIIQFFTPWRLGNTCFWLGVVYAVVLVCWIVASGAAPIPFLPLFMGIGLLALDAVWTVILVCLYLFHYSIISKGSSSELKPITK